jgi:hypothetical protein
MSENRNTRLVVFSVVLAAVAAVVGIFCIVVLPVALQAWREAAQRQRCSEELKQIGMALDQYRKRMPSSKTTVVAHDAKFPVDTYSGYFVSNKFEPNAAESFVVITNQEQFDNVFGVAMVMGDKSHRLPPDAFKSNIVLAVIKRGNAVWDFKVEGAAVNEGLVTLRYSATKKLSNTAAFNSPLIASIPKGNYKAVQFVENGKMVKQVETKVAPRPRERAQKP